MVGPPADKVDLVLYTHVLKQPAPSADGTTSPTEYPSGAFTFAIDRKKLLNQWSQLAFTFDSKQLKLFHNGALLKSFPLVVPGPLSENGGLIIGAHRGGTGRNFDGEIDEVAIWSRVLETKEISSLWNHGSPIPILSGQ